jgi:hypothetical protein
MKKLIGCFGLTSLLFVACNLSVQKSPIAKSPLATETRKPSEFQEAEAQLSKTFQLKDLPDGNHLFCTKSPSFNARSGIRERGYCFIFKKIKNNIIGSYFYFAPKGDNSACIKGSFSENIVTGVGYDYIFSSNKPIISATVDNYPYDPIWDEPIEDEEGGKLKVSRPYLYSTSEIAGDYYGWRRYDSIQLNLSKFYQRDIEKRSPPEKCPRF